MKTIGFIGGMSWESTQEYYSLANKLVQQKLGGFNSCSCIIDSLNFDSIEKLQHENNWEKLTEMMVSSAVKLEKAGASIVVLCTNTMHLCSDAIEEQISVPFLHIADATAEKILEKKFKKVALLGTMFTMEKPFYKDRLKEKYHIEVITPEEDDKKFIHNVIYNELVKGVFTATSRAKFVAIIDKLANQGAQGIILGCTEIPLLVSEKDTSVPLFNTTKIHVTKAIELALKN